MTFYDDRGSATSSERAPSARSDTVFIAAPNGRAAGVGRAWALTCDVVEFAEPQSFTEAFQHSVQDLQGMLREGRGTCSTKHLYLAQVLADRHPDTQPRIIHRVYTIDQQSARRQFGDAVAAVVPAEGIVDVHRYLTIQIDGHRVQIDATFPGPAWDGHSPMPLACGPGLDIPAGADPDAHKRRLEEQYCDPATREPFISALGTARLSA
jgi:hypothetical protein